MMVSIHRCPQHGTWVGQGIFHPPGDPTPWMNGTPGITPRPQDTNCTPGGQGPEKYKDPEQSSQLAPPRPTSGSGPAGPTLRVPSFTPTAHSHPSQGPGGLSEHPALPSRASSADGLLPPPPWGTLAWPARKWGRCSSRCGHSGAERYSSWSLSRIRCPPWAWCQACHSE